MKKHNFFYVTEVQAVQFTSNMNDYPDWFREALEHGTLKYNHNIAGLATLELRTIDESELKIAHEGDFIVREFLSIHIVKKDKFYRDFYNKGRFQLKFWGLK